MSPSSRRHATSFLKKCCLSVLVALALAANANAQQPAEPVKYAIPAGDLVQVINEISRNNDVQIVYDIELLRGLKSTEVKGSMTLDQALDRALEDSGLGWTRVNTSTVSIQKDPASSQPGKRESREQSPRDPAGENQQTETKELDEIVVVGSRLGTSPVESAMPIKLITREDIDRSGAGNIAQVLTYLSEIPLNSVGDREIGVGTGLANGGNTNSSTVQMRGLPRGTTLVLINGRRAGDSAMFSSSGQFDLSTIPLALVERIEVLPAGSSAVYGGDGLAGVINVVLRRDASGLELRFRKTAADGYDREMISAMWGKSWSKGSITVAANWNRNSLLSNSERSISADQDFRRFGGYDRRQPQGNPATVYSLAGCPEPPDGCYSIPLADRAPLPGLDFPVATVPLGQDGQGLTPSDFLATQGQANLSSSNRHIISAEENHGITVSGRVEVLPKLEAFSEFTYTKRSVPAYQIGFGFSYGEYGGPTARLGADHPFNPFGVPIGISYSYRNTGIYTSFAQQHFRALMGLRGKFGRFDWELSGMQSRDEANSYGAAGWDSAKIVAALAETDPAKALNPFAADGSAPASKEVLESLLDTDLDHDTASRGDVWTGFIRGPVLQLPAGNVKALLGLEHQRQEIRVDSNSVSLVTKYVNGVSTSNAAFAEVRVPILAPREGNSLDRIAMTGAMRRESSDRFQDKTQTETLGLEVRPTDSLLLRATYSTAFRPLLTYSAVQDPQPTEFYIEDPKLNFGYYAPAIIAGGVPPELRPETSNTMTMGVTYQPSADWRIALTHWDMKFRDRIAFVAPQTLIDNEEFFKERVVRDPVTGLVSHIDVRQININRYDSAGVDIAAHAYLPTSIGEFVAALSATYTYKHQTRLTDASPQRDNVAVHSSTGWAPRWKIVSSIGWEPRDGIHAMLVGRYVSRYRSSQALVTGPKAGRFSELGDFWIVDANVEMEVGSLLGKGSRFEGTRLALGATNVFDMQPEFCMGCGVAGYDASIYDIVGRTLYAELRMSF